MDLKQQDIVEADAGLLGSHQTEVDLKRLIPYGSHSTVAGSHQTEVDLKHIKAGAVLQS